MLKVTITDKESGIQKEVKISRTLSGDYMMSEHPHFDVIILTEKNKVLVLAKDEQDEHTYNLQEKLLGYMVKKGVILPETVMAGNVFGSLQGSFIQTPPGGENPIQAVVFTIANFIEDERPIIAREKEFEDAMEKELLSPSVEDSTEIGEVPQEPFKGSIPKYGFPTRGIYRYNY
jgi:hypothetical protein